MEVLVNQPLRVVCLPGTTSFTVGIGSSSSHSRRYDSQDSTSRTIPITSAAVAIISPGSGVKSTVTSTRSPRGRTPTPVERRFVASSATGIGRTYASSSAKAWTLRSPLCSERGISYETL